MSRHHQPAPWADLLGRAELPMSRRRLLQLTAASIALAGCDEETEGLAAGAAYSDGRQGPIRHYASHRLIDGFAVGFRARCRDGRPLLITGDPLHPASRGGCRAQTQAELLALYEPTRPTAPRQRSGPSDWRSVRRRLLADRPDQGVGMHLVLPPQSGPVTSAWLRRVQERWPRLQLHALSQSWQAHARMAAERCFGAALLPLPRLAEARVLVLADTDPFTEGPWAERNLHEHAQRRQRVPRPRVHVVEPQSRAGTGLADHRLALAGPRIGYLLQALWQRLAGAASASAADGWSAAEEAWLQRVASDLRQAGPAGLLLVGDRQPPAVHALAALINDAIGAVGTSLVYVRDPRRPAPAETGLQELATALDAGQVDELIVCGGDPVYASPADLAFGERWSRARWSCCVAPSANATAQASSLFIPQRHLLEGWGDGAALDGSWSFRQAALRPWRRGLDELELLALLAGEERPAAELVTRHIAEVLGTAAVEEVLQQGFVDEPAETLVPRIDRAAATALVQERPPPAAGPVVELRCDERLGDGAAAGNPWLQELPEPVTSQCWGNAARLAPALARRHGLRTGDRVRLASADGPAVEAPVVVVPGTAADSIVLTLGHGRRHGLAAVYQQGVDAYPLLPVTGSWCSVTLAPAAGREELALVQDHWSLEGRDVLRETSVAELTEGGPEPQHPLPSLRRAVIDEGRQWGMTIDLDRCIGCGACAMACQAENNVPVVGPDLVRQSLEMHWLRIDRYYRAGSDGAVIAAMPMACQHCERAPCEYVCPTAATTHSPDGLNEMTYNRCVGTRFCANNCPYKVRRFNFYEYHRAVSDVRALAANPSVTVRARGVMEKCSYCVQRIREAEQDAHAAGHELDASRVVTACEAACPSQAIAFGDVNDPASRVQAGREGPRAYQVLHEYGAAPRTRYLMRVRNPAEGAG